MRKQGNKIGKKQKKEEKHMFTLGAVAIGGTLVSGGLGMLILRPK